MKIVVTGVRGQLGFDVVLELEKRGHEVVGIDVSELDITDDAAVTEFFEATRPDALIHCAAYTATEKAEEEPDVCRKVNAEATNNLALMCQRIGAKMLYISTDYVFDGEGDKPFSVDDRIAPLSVYGKTKYEGEAYVREILERYFVVRISWVFGINGKNFVRTMLNLAQQRDTVSVVCDQVGSPTYAADLAEAIVHIIESRQTAKSGIYHYTNEGVCSWYDFAVEIARQSGNTACHISPCHSDEFPTKASRPHYSVLDKTKIKTTFGIEIPHWQESLTKCIENLNE